MTTYGPGLDYDEALDVLSHALSNVAPGEYVNPSKLQIDAEGHITHIEAGPHSGYIEGLGFQYESGTSVRVLPGAAQVPGLGKIVKLTSDQIVPSSSGNADDIFHYYLREINNIGFVEASTDPPSVYFGMAMNKGGDLFGRYIGMLRRRLSVIEPFTCDERGKTLRMLYETPPQIVSAPGGTAAGSKNIGIGASLAADRWVAPNTVSVIVEASANGVAKVGHAPTLAASRTVRSATLSEYDVALSPGQLLEYTTDASVTLTVNLVGYHLNR